LAVGILLGAVLAFPFVLSLRTRGGSPAIRLEDRVNPNTASVGSLVRLPGIGLTRATAIVAFRDQFAAKGGDGVAFRSPNDLQEIRGIGPKTVAGLAPWLRFDGREEGVSGTSGVDRDRRVMLESD
jgi:competence protein ComEA